MKKKVLFICTHNSVRSQMAEGYMRARYGDQYEAFSAGTEPALISSYAFRVMQEAGIDISGHRSKPLPEFFGKEMDVVVTVCDTARQTCPLFPWARETIHAGFPDPASFTGTEEEILPCFRKIRDEIFAWIDATFGLKGGREV